MIRGSAVGVILQIMNLLSTSHKTGCGINFNQLHLDENKSAFIVLEILFFYYHVSFRMEARSSSISTWISWACLVDGKSVQQLVHVGNLVSNAVPLSSAWEALFGLGILYLAYLPSDPPYLEFYS